MVQIKQKFNKINITALITCFMLIVVFVFGCAQFAFASSFLTAEQYISKANKQADYYIYVENYNYNGSHFIDVIGAYWDNKPSRVCALVTEPKGRGDTLYYIMSDTEPSNAFQLIGGDSDNVTVMGDITSNFEMTDYGYVYRCYTHSNKFGSTEFNLLTFSNLTDAENYMKTGQINNAIYKPKENIEYDSDIEVPINLDIQLNGSSDFVPNVRISCNQSESIDNRVLEVSYSVGYRATWRLMGGIGLNIKSKTSPVVYGSIEQLDDSFDNSGTAFETIISLSKFSNSSPPDKNSFSQYEPTPKVYWSLKEIKNENSEIKIWVRNRVGNKASKWVMVSGDSYKANFDVVSSDENGNPTDLKDNSANADTGYGSDYWNNRDTTPQEDYSGTNVKTNLKDLRSNYISLANFYKELFSFLPAEIWIILIGLVSTMVIIAIVKFVRG